MKEVINKISWWSRNFDAGEIASIADAIASGCVSQGAVTAELENRLAKALNVPYVVATTSGSMALFMAMMALGIKRGDEVIIPNRTWIATAHAPMILGAKVVLTDVLAHIPIMDVSKIKEKITSRTKAIIPVSLNGRAVEMDEVWNIAKEYGLSVVEDVAQGLFSRYRGQYSGKFMGTASDMGCFSFSIPKLITTGQGGFIVTKRKDIYETLKRIRMHGVDDVIDCTFHQLGFNFRFTDIQAAFGLKQFDRLEERMTHLKEIYSLYERNIKNIPFLKFIPINMAQGEMPLYTEVLCKKREQLINFLASRDIETRPFYPNLDTASYLGISGEFPNSKIFAEQGLILPCGPEQSLENIKRVIEALEFLGRDYQ